MRYFADVYPDMDVLRADIAALIYNGDLSKEQEDKFIKQLDSLIQQGYDEVDVWLHMQRSFNKFREELEQELEEECIA